MKIEKLNRIISTPSFLILFAVMLWVSIYRPYGNISVLIFIALGSIYYITTLRGEQLAFYSPASNQAIVLRNKNMAHIIEPHWIVRLLNIHRHLGIFTSIYRINMRLFEEDIILQLNQVVVEKEVSLFRQSNIKRVLVEVKPCREFLEEYIIFFSNFNRWVAQDKKDLYNDCIMDFFIWDNPLNERWRTWHHERNPSYSAIDSLKYAKNINFQMIVHLLLVFVEQSYVTREDLETQFMRLGMRVEFIEL